MAYACDFETLTTSPTRVWAWASSEIGNHNNCEYGTDIGGWFEWAKDKNEIWFHNLKFDGMFIVYYLLTHGFTHSKSREPNTFDTLISTQNTWYSITIYANGKKITIKDSLKKLPMTVSQIAKSFNLEDQKLELDYTTHREIGHQLTEHEIEYILADVKIVAQALYIQQQEGLKKLTIGSDALTFFKGKTGKHFESLFPQISIEVDSEIRSSYRGGFTYIKEGEENILHGEGLVFDVNSLYPSVMYYDNLPYGAPIFFEGKYIPDEQYNLYIIRFSAIFTVKKDHIPTIQLKSNRFFIGTEYIKESKQFVELTLTSVDFELFQEQYDIHEIIYHCGYKFKSTNVIFRSYIDHWMEVKINERDGKKQIAKLMLNSLYGKFAKNPDVTQNYPIIEDGRIRLVRGNTKISEPLYLPVGSFITAYARRKTITSAQQLYERFIYADTDSLHIKGTHIPNSIEIDPNKLGYWKLEGQFDKAIFIRPKRYIEVADSVFKVTCAGMPDNVKQQVTLDNFKVGEVFTGKLQPKSVPGGVILEERTFTLK